MRPPQIMSSEETAGDGRALSKDRTQHVRLLLAGAAAVAL
jgi:hypothetical protein